jgi:hypothetical protein
MCRYKSVIGTLERTDCTRERLTSVDRRTNVKKDSLKTGYERSSGSVYGKHYIEYSRRLRGEKFSE